MKQLIIDAEAASEIANSRKSHIDYDRLYYQSNEMLPELFNNFSVKDKDVLTVLASSDQLFHTYINGAKNVDTFDINKLTYYYYYLRKWAIVYYDEYYPPVEDLLFSHRFFMNMIKKYPKLPKEDLTAYYFWREYCNNTWGFQNSELFYLSLLRDENKIQNLDLLKEIIKKRKLSFIHMDISKPTSISKKYDVIILSNILEYLSFMDISFDDLQNNLNKLLKDDGVIICSHIMHRSAFEQSRMKSFIYKEFPSITRKSIIKNIEYPVGYSYMKKK